MSSIATTNEPTLEIVALRLHVKMIRALIDLAS
jgi:hypothetical protein